ncbi:MAG: ATP-binding protein [Gammaproteobacteria bacterium]|nr:ATP-binding protein [Gammaproteobacteria bacterium]
MKTQKLPSIRIRYFSLTLILATLVISFVFYTYHDLSEKNKIATQNLSKLDTQLNIIDKIRVSITHIYHSIDLFLLNPKEKEHFEVINSALLEIVNHAYDADLEIYLPDSANSLSLKDNLLNNFTKLQPLLNNLQEIRADVNLQYPGISISANLMAEQQSFIKSKLKLLQLEIENGDFKPVSKQLYGEILESRILVEKEISQVRIYIANRLALFSNEILTLQASSLYDFHLTLLKKLNLLKELYKKETGSFEGTDTVNGIIESQNKWYNNFLKLKSMSESDHWQEDNILVKSKILPLIKTSTTLLQLHNENLRQQKTQITKSFKENSRKLFYILSTVIAVFLISIFIFLISLELMVFKPILNIANVMKLKAFDQTDEQFSEKQSKETQNIVTAFTELESQIEQHTEELREAADNAIKAKDEAKKANAAKSTFLANMSHELRTPLHGILSFSDLGISKDGSLTADKSLLYFKAIHQSGERLSSLLEDLLELAKLEAGATSLTLSTSDLLKTTAHTVEQLNSHAVKKNLSITAHSSSPVITASYDREKISTVMYQLLSNAIKFTPADRQIDIYLSTVILDGRQCAKVKIQDQGIGIPDNEYESIFDKFVESSKTKTGAGGTGLGLAICAEIIKLHQGTIQIEKTGSEGACFTFIIPVDA